jgi:acetyl-CoA C-acetyltransferase
MLDVVILSGQRTAIGAYGGALKDVPPTKLGEIAIRAALSNSGVEPREVDHVVMGNVIHTEARDAYLSRVSGVQAGIPVDVPALTVNRLCGSGLQAIISAAQMIMLGDAKIAVAGGAESMSRGGYLLPSERWGARLGDATVSDMVVGTLTDPFGGGHMGVTAENVSQLYKITRAAQDEFALESHRRATTAIAEGHFTDQITPVELPSRKGVQIFDRDEQPKSDASISILNALKPVFQKSGTVTAGNASSLNDGAAAIVLANSEEASRRGAKPLARLIAYGHAGVEPNVMGLGPIPATRIALKRAGLSIADIDIIESNEAFAAQACAVNQELAFDPSKVNPNGGAIALGHPIGATGAILTIKAIYELRRRQSRYALVTMCIGGGQGIAAIFERL